MADMVIDIDGPALSAAHHHHQHHDHFVEVNH